MFKKKAMLLATMAAALMAFALPAAAQAEPAVWLDGGEEITEDGTIKATGTAGFMANSGLGGARCTVHVTAHLTAGTDKADITEFTITANTCEFTGALATVCTEVTSATSTASEENPWPATATKNTPGSTLDISGISITNVYKGKTGCPAGTVITGEAMATPNAEGGIAELTLSGEVSTSFGTATVDGSLALTENSGTFEIG